MKRHHPCPSSEDQLRKKARSLHSFVWHAAPEVLRPIVAMWLRVKNDLQCPVTHELFVRPVCASDGHTYEYDTVVDLYLHSKRSGLPVKSPLTNAPLAVNQFGFPVVTTNQVVKKIVQSLSNPYQAAPYHWLRGTAPLPATRAELEDDREEHQRRIDVYEGDNWILMRSGADEDYFGCRQRVEAIDDALTKLPEDEG